MKFLVDAQLPRRLASRLRKMGYDAVHTLDLPHGNRTTDAEINDLSEHEDRIVVTKDSDFVHSFLLTRKPPKLLLISTGNSTNKELEALLLPQVPAIVAAFTMYNYIELNRVALIFHV